MKKINLTIAAVTAVTLATSAHAATIINLEDNDAQRTQDTDRDGIGNSVTPQFLFVGNAGTTDFHPVYVFEMLGAGLGSNITDAQFSVTQTGTHTPEFTKVDAFVLRTAVDATILASDYELAGTKLMDDFAGTVSGGVPLKSLDAGGQSSLTTYLQNNWQEGEYLFFSLRGGDDTTIPYTSSTLNGYIFGNSSGGWTEGSTDALLTITAVPEPTSAALIGLGGLALLLRRQR